MKTPKPNKPKQKQSGTGARLASGWLLVPCLAGGAWATAQLLVPAGESTVPSAATPGKEAAKAAPTVNRPVTPGFTATQFPNVNFQSAPSANGSAVPSDAAGAMVYVKPGHARPSFAAQRSTAATAPRVSQGTTAAGGVKMEFSPRNFPYMRSTRGADGKTIVKCVEPLNQKIDHAGHNH